MRIALLLVPAILLLASTPTEAAEPTVYYRTIKYNYQAADGGVVQSVAPGPHRADRLESETPKCYYLGASSGRHCWQPNATTVSIQLTARDCPMCVLTNMNNPTGAVGIVVTFVDATGASLGSSTHCGLTPHLPIPAGTKLVYVDFGGAAGYLACGSVGGQGIVTYQFGWHYPVPG